MEERDVWSAAVERREGEARGNGMRTGSGGGDENGNVFGQARGDGKDVKLQRGMHRPLKDRTGGGCGR
jgi:hypothetical protein